MNTKKIIKTCEQIDDCSLLLKRIKDNGLQSLGHYTHLISDEMCEEIAKMVEQKLIDHIETCKLSVLNTAKEQGGNNDNND